MSASRASSPGEAVGQDAAPEIAPEFPFYVIGDAVAKGFCFMGQGEVGLQVMFFTERLEAPGGISGRIPGTSRVSTTSSILWDGGGGYTLVPDRISWVLPTKLVAPAFSLLTLSRNGQMEPRLPAAIRTGVGTLEALQKLTGASRVKSVGTT